MNSGALTINSKRWAAENLNYLIKTSKHREQLLIVQFVSYIPPSRGTISFHWCFIHEEQQFGEPGGPFANRTVYRDANSPTFAPYIASLLRKRSPICSFPQCRRESRRRASQFDEIYCPTFRPYDLPFSQSPTARFLRRLTASWMTPEKTEPHPILRSTWRHLL